MARKVRKQIYIELHQEKLLKRRAKEHAVPEAELIRRGLDQILAQGGTPASDREAWREERAFIQKRAEIPALGGKRAWARKELHRERISG